MAKFFVARFVSLVLVLWAMSIIVFVCLRVVPGDPITTQLGSWATKSEVDRVRGEMGLDRPLPVQYGIWLRQAVLQFDLGTSLQSGLDVRTVVAEKFQNTLVLVLAASLLSVILGVVLGTVAAARRGTIVDRATTVFAISGVSIPVFWVGMIGIWLFSVKLGLTPSGGMHSATGDRGFTDLLHHLALPALVLGAASAGPVARVTRGSLVQVLQKDYVRTARAKGLPGHTVLLRHALRNAASPIITFAALQTGFLIGGTVVVEIVFSWPGLGQEVYGAVSSRDYPVLQAIALLLAAAMVICNAAADLAVSMLDPQVRMRV